jgi:ABC-type branched-subunit amino acid transport system permease subunit
MTAPAVPSRRDSLTSSRAGRTVIILLIVGVATAVPAFASPYAVGLVDRFMVFSILAISMDLLWGYGGVVSFGHAMFFGLGAYATAITLNNIGGVGGTYLAFTLGLAVPSLLALGLGYFLFYFGIITLALSVVFETLAIVNRNITGGLDGLYGFAIPTIWIPGLGDVEIWGTVNPYYAGLIGLVIAFVLSVGITRSSFGTAIKAIRDDESRLEMLGYNTAFLKTVLLVIACAMAGFAGSLYTTVGFVSSQLFAVFFSTQVLVWVGIGGRGTLVGPILGTFIVGALETVLSGQYQDVWPLLVGLFFLLVVLFWPSGLYPFLQKAATVARRPRLAERTP